MDLAAGTGPTVVELGGEVSELAIGWEVVAAIGATRLSRRRWFVRCWSGSRSCYSTARTRWGADRTVRAFILRELERP